MGEKSWNVVPFIHWNDVILLIPTLFLFSKYDLRPAHTGLGVISSWFKRFLGAIRE
jgi:hypothetical protein